jgi:prepilin signal peptidase PulO-like enzyme (type II secretory pathway)
VGASEIASMVLPGILVLGLAYAGWEDWRRREVSDRLWQILGVAGAALGAIALGATSLLALGTWAIVALFVLQHFFPWDVPLERRWPGAGFYVEVAIYLAVIGALSYLVFRQGIGGAGVPIAVVAVLATALVARSLFELRVLYGGADAKAVMVAGLLVPIFASPLLPLPDTARFLLSVYPYPMNLLMDAAILSAAIPLALALLNVRRGTFAFPSGFTTYRLPVARLGDAFVWVRDPALPEEADTAETSEEDRQVRLRQKAELERLGRTEVTVTPQLPFVVLLAAGAVAALLAGNLVFDAAALL